MDKVSVYQKLELFQEYWSPKIVGEVNDTVIKLAKLNGEFLWHLHENEDEMFYVLKGTLLMRFRDKDVTVGENEFIVIPKGVEHMPVAQSDVHVMLIEPKGTLNTGNVQSERTIDQPESI